MNRSLLIFPFLILSLFNNNLNAQNIDHWETVVFADQIWSYRLGTSEPPANWKDSDFDDSSWSTGSGGIGYGDGDDNTTIGPSLSLYIRIDFNIIDTSKISMALLHADYDDAFVAYLNGEEFARGVFEGSDTPAFDDAPPYDHEAALYDGGVPESYPIYPESTNNLLLEGQNTLAIQIHNASIFSSDMSSNFFFSLGINDTSTDYDPTPPWFYEPFLSTNLPLVLIKTNGQDIVDEPRIVADMQVIDNGPGNLNFITDPVNDYNGKIAIEIRGASSQFFAKKNYGFETQDNLGENNNYPLLGMPAENDWILHGPYSDKSLIRNALTFDLGRKMMDYASRTRFCELMINDDYRGVYLLMERIKRDDNRVDIATLKPEDILGDELTGGYVFQLDRDNEDTEEDGWYSPYGSNPFYAFHSPDYDDLLPVQKSYIQDWMSDFEFAMLQPDFASTYDDYINLESFVNYFLINELTKHVDAFKLSFYMYKKKDSNGGKLHMGPIWDFNLGYSNFTFECPPEPEGWIYPCTSRAFWLNKILDIDEVQNLIYCRWEDLRNTTLHTDSLTNTIDQMTLQLEDAQQRNFSRWNILGVEIWPNYFVGDTYQEEVNFLENWLLNRVSWMDQNMLGIPNDCLTSTEEDLINGMFLKTFPNPFSDRITFILKNENFESGEVQIHNSLGQQVDVFKLEAEAVFHWDTSLLIPGIYFYTLKVGEQTYVGKLVKE